MSELVAGAIASAVQKCGLPDGVFSLLNGRRDVGQALVSDPRVKAVGFTGSRAGGLAFAKIAAERKEPIPVYAEMSSINPVVLAPGALKARARDLGAAFVGSLTMGAGQFCTNPGLVLGVAGEGLDQFCAAAADAVKRVAPQVMLTPGIHDAYADGVRKLMDRADVENLAQGEAEGGANQCQAGLFVVDASAFLGDSELSDESVRRVVFSYSLCG